MRERAMIPPHLARSVDVTINNDTLPSSWKIPTAVPMYNGKETHHLLQIRVLASSKWSKCGIKLNSYITQLGTMGGSPGDVSEEPVT